MTKMNALTASLLVINLQSAAFAAEPKQDSASIAEKRKTVPLSILKKLNIVVKDPATNEWVLDIDKLKGELTMQKTPFDLHGIFEEAPAFDGEASGNW